MSFRDETPAPSAEPPWVNQARQLSTAWLTSFGQAIAALSKDGISSLFHPFAIVFGQVKDGYGPCSEFDALQFAFVIKGSKIAPLDRAYTLITVEWMVKPVLPESPPERGCATFVLCVVPPRYLDNGDVATKGSVKCIHAHYSRRAHVYPKNMGSVIGVVKDGI